MGKPKTLRMVTSVGVTLALGILMAGITVISVGEMHKIGEMVFGPKTTMVDDPTFNKAQDSENFSAQLAKVLPPVTGESPEVLELKKNPPPPHPERGEARSKADLMRACGQQPQCRQKLNEAKSKGKSKRPLPGNAGRSTDELDLDKFPAPPLPAEGLPRQKSQLPIFSNETPLLGWLNPFFPSVAQAQTDVSIHLTPCNKRHSLAGLAFWGVDLPFSNPYARFVPLTKTRASSTNYLPYLSMYFNAPATGWYILSFRATRAAASLRHQYNGPVLETWNFMSEPNGWYNYVTIEYLAQGNHTFVWWGTEGWPHLASVTITSFP